MRRAIVFKALLVINVLLAGALILRLHNRGVISAAVEAQTESQTPGLQRSVPTQESINGGANKVTVSATPFSMVYSTDPKTFAANLRAIGCPEDTVRDILTAEVHRLFREQEELVRPTPADHVPWGWSAMTTEPRLVERREQAAELVRRESGILREALGCTALVALPQYAMTSSEQQFEGWLAAFPGLDACSVRQLRDTYWTDVHQLLERTRGFWLPEDLAELENLKKQHRQELMVILPDPGR